MNKKKTIRLRTLLIIEVILIIIGSFFIFRAKDSTAESQKKEAVLQQLEFIKKQTSHFYEIDVNDTQTLQNIMQAEVDSLAYAHQHIPDFEITPQIRNAFSFGEISINPTLDDSRSLVTSTASDGTVYALDVTEYKESAEAYDTFEIADLVFPQLFEEQDLFFVLDENGTILDYPSDSQLEGKNISRLGIKFSEIVLEDGTWLKIHGKKYFTFASKDEDLGYIYVGACNVSSFKKDNQFVSILVCSCILLIISLLITYTYFSRQEDLLKKELENNSEIKNRNPWVFGVIALLAITASIYHIQSLFSFSMFNMVKQTEFAILETWIDTNEDSFPSEIQNQNTMNNIISKSIVGLISSYPELQGTEHLDSFAKMYSLSFIKLFDPEMNEIGTTPITQEDYSSFEENYYPLYPITPMDRIFNTSGPMMLTAKVGVPNLEKNKANTLVIGFDREHFYTALSELELIDIVSAFSKPGDIEVVAVESDTKTIAYASLGRYMGVPIDRIGIDEATLQDKHFNTMTLDGVYYYSITKGINNYIIYLMEPAETLFEGRSNIVLTTTLFSALNIIAMLYLMSRFEVTPLPAPETDSDDNSRYQNIPDILDRIYNWEDKTAEEKIINIAQILLNVFVVMVLIIIYFRSSLQDSSSLFGFIVSGQWQRGLNLFAATAVAITCMIYAFIMNIIRFTFNKLLQIVNPKVETILRLLHSFVVYLSMIGLIFYCLYLFGMDSKSILASAGILGLVISWGSQDLLTDILAGLFIVFEKQFHVNDIIEINGQRGTVTEIGVRTTRIVTTPGDILYVSNRNLSKILNKTETISGVGITLYVGFDQNIPEIENMLREELPRLNNLDPAMLSGPSYSGVLDLNDQYARLLVGFTCQERDKFRLSCMLNAELCKLFDKHGFEMGIDPIELKL